MKTWLAFNSEEGKSAILIQQYGNHAGKTVRYKIMSNKKIGGE